MRSVLFLLAGAALAVASETRAQQPGQEVVPAGHRARAEPPGTCQAKVCVTEAKATTKVVHGSTCKDYCQEHILPNCVRARLGLSCDCGIPRTYNVLTKKVVPGPDAPVCKVKDLSAPAAPATPK